MTPTLSSLRANYAQRWSAYKHLHWTWHESTNHNQGQKPGDLHGCGICPDSGTYHSLSSWMVVDEIRNIVNDTSDKDGCTIIVDLILKVVPFDYGQRFYGDTPIKLGTFLAQFLFLLLLETAFLDPVPQKSVVFRGNLSMVWDGYRKGIGFMPWPLHHKGVYAWIMSERLREVPTWLNCFRSNARPIFFHSQMDHLVGSWDLGIRSESLKASGKEARDSPGLTYILPPIDRIPVIFWWELMMEIVVNFA